MKKFKKHIIALLALLTISATGAWAQTETLLTTIESKAPNNTFTSGSKTFDDIATVTFSGEVRNDGDERGWYRGSNDVTLTVAAANDGYTITRVKFFNDYMNTSAFDEAAPFEAALNTRSVVVNGTDLGRYGVTKIEVYGYETPAEPAGPEVTITGTSTEGQQAEFDMPQNDVTVTYTLKRDMKVDVHSTIADRIRIKKDDEYGYVPVDANEILPVVTDELDENNPVTLNDDEHYTRQLQKQSETADDWTDVDLFSVGTFRWKLTGTGSYTGTIYTAPFQLFEGYELTIPAGEYATYYRTDDALYVEDENVKLYTITAVNGTEATATEVATAPKEMPLLVKNTGTSDKVLLIPAGTDRTPETGIEIYTGFKGTTTATTVEASDAATDRYALNGQEFVWVKNAISIAANKCWLEVSTGAQQSARRLSIVFGGNGTTGIGSLTPASSPKGEGDWYDLNGRKLNGKPTKKGVYIQNGKKVVVK